MKFCSSDDKQTRKKPSLSVYAFKFQVKDTIENGLLFKIYGKH